MRVGTGYDSHRFDPDRKLMLGGVEIPGAPGLTGHSDGDAVAHAVTDALLGAAAEGDIGSHFPPGDPRWRDADSMDLLGRVVALLRQRRLRVINVDVTVICETPRIGPHAGGMRARIGEVLGTGREAVSIKGKTNEGMGWIGAGDGIAVHAVALIGKEDT
ncbi:MAG: 2-C-methyl-D-erythritol 2,4-cyclodiphosphate synthase [Gammaproteobacteria bacterium]|nr:2-C-methyl-D-erythritol 2,4-cyclodiphosphate synthase [Gammaproteobacteria bacterium]